MFRTRRRRRTASHPIIKAADSPEHFWEKKSRNARPRYDRDKIRFCCCHDDDDDDDDNDHDLNDDHDDVDNDSDVGNTDDSNNAAHVYSCIDFGNQTRGNLLQLNSCCCCCWCCCSRWTRLNRKRGCIWSFAKQRNRCSALVPRIKGRRLCVWGERQKSNGIECLWSYDSFFVEQNAAAEREREKEIASEQQCPSKKNNNATYINRAYQKYLTNMNKLGWLRCQKRSPRFLGK